MIWVKTYNLFDQKVAGFFDWIKLLNSSGDLFQQNRFPYMFHHTKTAFRKYFIQKAVCQYYQLSVLFFLSVILLRRNSGSITVTHRHIMR